MPKKKTLVIIQEQNENSDSPIEYSLTVEEWRLVNAYFETGMNQTQAYLKVYPDSGYDSARTTASTLFAKPNVKAGVRHLLKEKAMPAEEVLARLGDMARATHHPFIRIDSDGFIYFDFSEPEAINHLHLIKKIKTKRERRVDGNGKSAETWEGEWVEVELHDAKDALVQLGRHYKLFTDKLEGGGANGEFVVENKIDDERFDRAISTLANVIREGVSGKSNKSDGEVDTSK